MGFNVTLIRADGLVNGWEFHEEGVKPVFHEGSLAILDKVGATLGVYAPGSWSHAVEASEATV